MLLWTYDLAREQCPTEEFLHRLCLMTLEAGYDGIGLYLEHRFAYPSTPWAHGKDALEPDAIRRLQKAYPGLQIVPFINLLGHTEGFLYTEPGKRFAEEKFKGLQACPSTPDFVSFANQILDDTLQIFDSKLIHIGGDETAQLGICANCRERAKESLYAEHFGPLAERVVATGRRPGLWGDMFLEHPGALAAMPKESLIFDWQYFDGFAESTPKLASQGHEVVCCPTLHTYNSAWLHVEPSYKNADQALAQPGKAGMCLTTWECALMGNYETLLPVVGAVGRSWKSGVPIGDSPAIEADQAYIDWVRQMGVELPALGGPFAFSQIRSGLKCRLLLYGNPFLAWMHHADDLCGPIGDAAMHLADQAMTFAPDSSARGVSVFVRKAVEFVRFAEQARQAYANELPGLAASTLAPCRQIFEDLEKVAIATYHNAGGSKADIERCRAAKRHVETVVTRIKQYGAGELGYLPAWEILTHPKFMPHDQGSWWLINKWANE